MQTYNTRIEFESDDKQKAIVHVESKLTYYKVVFNEGKDWNEITILSAGLEVNGEALMLDIFEKDQTNIDLLVDMFSFEQVALLLVMILEEK